MIGGGRYMNGAIIHSQKQKEQRLGLISYNNQSCLMKIVEYNSATDIIVEFQDDNKARVHTRWDHFQEGAVKNPYYKDIYGIACPGNKVKLTDTKREYQAWVDMLRRCYDEKYLIDKPTYVGCNVCDEWTNYENFYIWIINQENYDKWKSDTTFHVDKDILFKHNKVYSPKTCCLVPNNVNTLFVKSDGIRGVYPIGVSEHYKDSGTYMARCNNPLIHKNILLGIYSSPNDAFMAYKKYKETLIKTIAEEEYKKQNIIQSCYNAMMNYEVEITD